MALLLAFLAPTGASALPDGVPQGAAGRSGDAPAAGPSEGQRAGEVASLVELAVTEYADAVAGGRVVNEAEYGEARQLVEEARRSFEGLGSGADGAVARRVAAGLDSLAGVARRKGSVKAFRRHASAVAGGLARGWGAVSAPSPPEPPSAARGAALYRKACAACHGPAGRGDGWAADNMTPPPADLASRRRHREATPARDFQVTMYGIPETGMPASKDWLSTRGAWDLAAYLQSLRYDGAQVAEGKALALEGLEGPDGEGSPVSGWLRPWSSPEGGGRLTDRELRRRIQEEWRDARGDTLSADRARSVVAYVRTLMGTPREGVPEADASERLAATVDRADSLVRTAVHLREEGDAEEASSAAVRSYMVFEGVEPTLRSRDPSLTRETEMAFGAFRQALSGDDLSLVEARAGELSGLLASARERLTTVTGGWWLATKSFFLILREGFEAILIVGAIIAFLLKTGHDERLREIYGGVAAALVASVLTAVVLERVLSAAPADRELLEGITMLLAVVVLFSVSYWLVSKLEHEKWEAYLREKMQGALGTGSSLALAGVAFLAVYREGFETVLFYGGLFSLADAGFPPIAAGFLAGCAALAVIYLLYTRFGMRIPMRPFFALTSGVLYYMAVVFAGSGIRELQEAGVVGMTYLTGVPQVELVGLYPTLETLAAQGLLLLLLVAGLWVTFGRSRRGGAGADAAAAGTAGPGEGGHRTETAA